MKKIFFPLVIVLLVSLSTVSCTTDSYDADMEQNTANTYADDSNETIETDPIIIPKKD